MMDRRTFLRAGAAAGLGVLGARRSWGLALAAPPAVPSPSQLAWQRGERAMFCHFGVNTFTDREWGDGTEDPRVFNPTRLDARQWARAAREAGFVTMILTAKHHDGFCLWPSAYTDHCVKSSPWRGGQGDVVREFSDAAREQGLGVGLYLSPWDRHEPSYGDSPAYNDYYVNQLTELLTGYGPLVEVWFDGANGEGPNGKRQVYDWPRFHRTVRDLQPNALMFSDAGPDIRWIGNERGVAGDPNWCAVDPAVVREPGMSGPGVRDELQHGDPRGTVWRPGEADVSIRPGWFWHASQDDEVRDLDNLIGLYFSSVGRNANLLLNVPPTTEGLLHTTDVARISAMRRRLDDLFAENLALRGRATPDAAVAAGHGADNVLDADPDTYWSPRSSAAPASLELAFDKPVTFDVVDLREPIALGQTVSAYTLSGSNGAGWSEIARGTTIGHRKLDRVAAAPVSRVRLTIESAVGEPRLGGLGLYSSGDAPGR